ncbi:MAG: hypothetical protein FWJ74_01400 [Gemmatimonadota bacterium]
MSELGPELEEWIAALRREPVPRPEAIRRLRRALRAEEARVASRLNTPAIALAAASIAVVLTSAVWFAHGRGAVGGATAPEAGLSAAATAADDPDSLVPAQFVLHVGGARSVSVVGDFNDWDPQATPLAYAGDGVWSVVVRVRPGPVRYAFLVNGTEWRADPAGVSARSDFGRPTSVAFISRQVGR